jgi:proteasome beta subunit
MVLATSLGVKFRNGVVLAADRRVSYGGFILSKAAKKVMKINERVGLSMSGLPADFQELSEILSYNIALYEMDIEKKATPTNIARLLSIIMYQRRFSGPFYAEMLIGGLEQNIPKIIVLDPAGGMLEEDYAATGTGAQMATGILERYFKKDLERDEAVEIAERAMRAAIERDALSGDGIDILIISDSGTEEKFVPARIEWRDIGRRS